MPRCRRATARADANADPHPHTDTNADPHADATRHGDTYPDPDAYSGPDLHPGSGNVDPHNRPNGNADGNTPTRHTDSGRNADTHRGSANRDRDAIWADPNAAANGDAATDGNRHPDPDADTAAASHRAGMMAATTPRTRSRRTIERRRGAVAVETAILGTLLIMMFFGALEMGLLMRTRARLTDATRDGVRTAASLPRFDGFQNNALAAVRGVLNGEELEFVTIYRADPSTGLPTGGQPFESCFTDCFMYENLPGPGLVQRLGADWNYLDQKACGGLDDTDWIGVYVRSKHEWVSGILSGSKTLTDHVVMRLEPLQAGTQCRP